MKRCVVPTILALALALDARAQQKNLFSPDMDKSTDGGSGRIYTPPDPKCTGGIEGSVEGEELTHCMAIDHERAKVYRAVPANEAKSFRFDHMAVGKYDLVLVTRDRGLFEGLALGDAAKLSTVSSSNLTVRVAKADAFFNLSTIHRFGVEGERLLVLVERISSRNVLKQSGEKLGLNVRRLEIGEYSQAADDWQQVDSRHIYRQGEPIDFSHVPFMNHYHVEALGNIRVVDSMKSLGVLTLRKR